MNYFPLSARSWTLALILLLGVPCTFSSCSDDEDDELIGNWVRRSDFEGTPRSDAVSFVIGDFAYVGLGYDGDEDLRDFWRYDARLDFWTRMDDFPGSARRAAVAFSTDERGYVGTGFDSDNDVEFRDFYAFDPAAASGSQWSVIADFPGSARYNAVAFAEADRGYVGSGYDGNWLKDFYAYDPATDSWEQIVSIGGSKREAAAVMSIDGRHYVVTGRNNNQNEFDAWAYDVTSASWEQLNDLDEDDDYNIARYGAVAFSMNGLGYVTTGTSGFNVSSTWEYSPTTDEWEEKSAFEGAARRDAVSFVVNGRAYVTTGASGSTRLDDLREFLPDDESDDDD